MKCNQKLCQRTKNLKESGNCNVCDDVIAEALKRHDDLERKKPSLADIQVDLKVLVEAHKKLSNGTPIDPKVVSSLILAGIVNVLNQHDTIAALEERVKTNTKYCNNKSEIICFNCSSLAFIGFHIVILPTKS